MKGEQQIIKQQNNRLVREVSELGFVATARLKTLLGARLVERLIIKQLKPKRYVIYAKVKGKLIQLSTKRVATKPRVFMSVEVVRRFIERSLGLQGKLLIEFSVDTKQYKFLG